MGDDHGVVAVGSRGGGEEHCSSGGDPARHGRHGEERVARALIRKGSEGKIGKKREEAMGTP